MANGFITLHRKMLEWEWADDPYMVCLWVHLLLLANHEGKKWHGMAIERGQLITDLRTLAKRTGLSIQQVRTRLDRLVESDCINKQITNKYTLITICNYGKYQDVQQINNKQITNKQQTNNKQITHNNNDNKEINNNFVFDNACTHEEVREAELWTNDDFFKELSEADEHQSWREMVCMNLKIPPEELVSKLKQFSQLVNMRKEAHKDVNDYSRHFINYINGKQYGAITAGQQYLSRDEQRKREAEARKRETAERIQELIGDGT